MAWKHAPSREREVPWEKFQFPLGKGSGRISVFEGHAHLWLEGKSPREMLRNSVFGEREMQDSGCTPRATGSSHAVQQGSERPCLWSPHWISAVGALPSVRPSKYISEEV